MLLPWPHQALPGHAQDSHPHPRSSNLPRTPQPSLCPKGGRGAARCRATRARRTAPLRAHVCSPALGISRARRSHAPPSLPSPPAPTLRGERHSPAVPLAPTPQQCQKQQRSRMPCKVLKLFSKYFQFGKESLDMILL